MERQKYRIKTNASQKEGFGRHRSFPVKILTVIAILSLAMALSCPDSFALDPPPACEDAYYGGDAWGTVNINPKILHDGDMVTVTATHLMPASLQPRWVCDDSGWVPLGSGGVTISFYNYNLDLVDYQPRASATLNVTTTVNVNKVSVVWQAILDPAPPDHVSDHCWCDMGFFWDMSGCDPNFHPNNLFGLGVMTFTVTLKAKGPDFPAPVWTLENFATFTGGRYDYDGPSILYSDTANDYYRVGGTEVLTLTADPTSLPADGTPSVLSAHVYEQGSGISLPRQTVTFSAPFGDLIPASVQTDSNGIATAGIASWDQTGQDLVTASIPGTSAQTIVTFTEPVNPPVNPRSILGNGDGRSLIAEPVHAGLGNYVTSKPLFSFPGRLLPFTFSANYNSLDTIYNGPLGFGWTHTYNVVLTLPTPPSTDVTIKWGDGHEETFHGDGSGNFTPINCTDAAVTLTMPDASHYLATLYDKTAYQFDSGGRLLAISDLNGNQIALTYSTTNPNLIDHITDTAGRQIAFTYDVSGPSHGNYIAVKAWQHGFIPIRRLG